jgi:tetratricopeptide (TPR) repeat protein/DNA-binding XRE family transcriptional regulator
MPDEQEAISSFGTWLRRQRKVHDLTQAELAQRVGCTRETIKRIETDVRRPSKVLAARIALILAVPSEEHETVIQVARGRGAVDRLPFPAGPMGTRPMPMGGELPHQLRTPLPDFVGQQDAIASLLAALSKATHDRTVAAISGLRGMGGIGKTELAFLVANRLTDSFPDAQLVLNLRGMSAEPLPVEQALAQVIHAFTPDAKLDTNLEALQIRYRSALHGRRALILADDARDAAQVQPLLPPAGCALLVTSRQRFSLPGMTSVDLEVLSDVAAVSLLRSVCPRLADGEARTLARLCGGLPLALRISGSLLHNDPAVPVADYLRQLGDERQRLAQLRDPDDAQLDVQASLRLSYAQLDERAQQLFRQLGVLVGDFASTLACALVAGSEAGAVEAGLRQLLRRNLVLYDVARARWRLHDLVGDLARGELAARGEAEAAQWRYAQAAVARATQMRKPYLAGGEGVLGALAAFDAERPHIDEACRWAQRHAQTSAGDQLLLDVALAIRHIGSLRYDPRQESIPLWEGVRQAACRLDDYRGESIALNYLGIAYSDLGEPQTAITYHKQRLALVRNFGDRRSEGATLSNLGVAYYDLGEPQTAITYYEHALAIARDLGNRHGECQALGNLGVAYHDLGELQTAITHYEHCLAIARDLGARYDESIVLANLGNAYIALGESGHAITLCAEALAIVRELGDRRNESYVLSYLACAQAYPGEIAQAMTTFDQALALFRDWGDRWGEAECQWQFGLALARQGERQRALPLLRSALAYQQEIGHAKAAERAALIAHLEAGGDLPLELLNSASYRAVKKDEATTESLQ